MSEMKLRLGLSSTSDQKLVMYLRDLCGEHPAICDELTVRAIQNEALARIIESIPTIRLAAAGGSGRQSEKEALQ